MQQPTAPTGTPSGTRLDWASHQHVQCATGSRSCRLRKTPSPPPPPEPPSRPTQSVAGRGWAVQGHQRAPTARWSGSPPAEGTTTSTRGKSEGLLFSSQDDGGAGPRGVIQNPISIFPVACCSQGWWVQAGRGEVMRLVPRELGGEEDEREKPGLPSRAQLLIGKGASSRGSKSRTTPRVIFQPNYSGRPNPLIPVGALAFRPSRPHSSVFCLQCAGVRYSTNEWDCVHPLTPVRQG